MRRAFTLVEVMVIITVLAVVSALALPNVVALARGRARDEAYNEVLRIAQMGREVAIQRGSTYVLSLGADGSTVILEPEEENEALRDTRESSTNATTTQDNGPRPLPSGIAVGGGAGNSIDGSRNSGSGLNIDENGASVTLPTGVSIGQVVLDGASSNTSDFKLHFFPDGQSESGGFEMIEGSTTRSLQIDRNGMVKLEEDSLPDAAEDRWEAGQYEQRASS